MCENCYTAEFRKFQNAVAWDKFEFDLSKKLVAEKMKYVKNEGKTHKDGSLSIYECTQCDQIWLLKAPNDYFGGGYFLRDLSK